MNETWTYSWAIRNVIAELLMPPSIWILLALFAWIFFRKQSKIKTTLIGLSFVMIWITSTIAFSQWFFQVSDHWMHWPAPLPFTELAKQEQSLNNTQANTQPKNQATECRGQEAQPRLNGTIILTPHEEILP
jgi:hypothetical protein